MRSTPRQQIDAFLEMCIVYIEQAASLEALDSLGLEIAAVRTEIGATSEDLAEVKRRYVLKRRTYS